MAEDAYKKHQTSSSTKNHIDSEISMPNGCTEKQNLRVSIHFSFLLVIYEFQLHSTHGDAYYIGLNGLEFYDEHGENDRFNRTK